MNERRTQGHAAPIAPDTAPVRRTWDTSYVRPRDRFSYFRESVCQAYFALSPEVLNGQSVDARLERVEVPQGFISNVSITPHRLVRTHADVARLPDEFVAINFLPHASGGDVFLVDFNQIVDVDINFPQKGMLSLIVTKSSLPATTPSGDAAPSNKTSLHALRSCMQTIRNRYAHGSAQELAYLVSASVSLFSAALIEDSDFLQDKCCEDEATQRGILQLVRDFTQQNLKDPSLSALSVAAHFGVSSRYIQKLFAAQGLTYKSFVTAARLDQINMDLQDVSIAHLSPGDIALRWGFRDMTTFHRNFKQRFDDTPGQARRLTAVRASSERRLLK